MRRTALLPTLALAATLAPALSACGGGDGIEPTAPATPDGSEEGAAAEKSDAGESAAKKQKIDEAAAAGELVPQSGTASADRLAEAGRIAEAVHELLLASIAALKARAGTDLRAALTSREIAESWLRERELSGRPAMLPRAA